MQPGDVFAGQFVVEEFAGKGGMGTVFRARESGSGKVVALKLLHSEREHDDQRFAREADLLAQLEHPGIVRYVASGVADNRVRYLVMEWLGGETLAMRVARGPLGVTDSVEIGLAVARALAAAHSVGVVHRDIKPSNLMLVGGSTRDVRLLDFGVAWNGDPARTHTRSGVFIGTPGYLAPEQARGQREPSATADVFSLGAVLFECLTGRPAFAADHVMSLLAKLVLEDAPWVSAFVPDVPQALDDLVARMLAKDPSERPRDGAEVAAELERIASFENPAPASRMPDRLTHHEQRLVSIVAAPGHSESTLETVPDSAPALPLHDALERLGTRVDRLADGSLVCTLVGGVASDLTDRAARCALIVHRQCIGVPVVVATGRGVVAGRLPVGEAIDRAVSRLRVVQHGDALQARIHIDELTAGLLGPSFEVRGDSEGLYLAGMREHQTAERTVLGRRTECVGRARELAYLDSLVDECATDRVPRIVLVTGSAGMGKSRLLSELRARVASRRPEVDLWLAHGDVFGAGSPFGLVGRLIRQAAGIRDGEPLEVRRRKLRSRMLRYKSDTDANRIVVFLGEIAGVPFPDAESVMLRAARADSMLMAGQIERAWLEFMTTECGVHPLVVLLEDLHWGDLPTVRLALAAIRRQDLPLLVVATGRPEVRELFPALLHERGVEELRLGGLSPRAARELATSVLDETASDATLERLIDRADGNPFYLEELIRAVAAGTSGSLPPTVLATVQVRLDALDPGERQVLRAASVFGESFWAAGVTSLLGADAAANFAATLQRLETTEIVQRVGESRFHGEVEYAFRHALLREAAYATLTERDRVVGHAVAGRWLEATGEQDPVVLAEHFEQGGRPRQAIPFWRRAAEQALEGGDLVAAIQRADRGLESGAEGEERGALFVLRGEAELWRGDNIKAERSATQALPLLEPGGAAWCIAASGVFVMRVRGANPDVAGAQEVLIDLMQTPPKDDALFHYIKACSGALAHVVYAGAFQVARLLLMRIQGYAQGTSDDAPIRAWERLAMAYVAGFCDGNPYQRIAFAREALAAFRECGDARGETVMYVDTAAALRCLGQFETSEQWLSDAHRIAEQNGLGLFITATELQRGATLARAGRFDAARPLLVTAANDLREKGNVVFSGVANTHLAHALLGTGDAAGAADAAAEAVDVLAPALAFRVLAYAELSRARSALGRHDEALAAALEANALLDNLGATVEGELFARLTLAQARRACGDEEAALASLERAHARLVELADTIDDMPTRRAYLEQVTENATIIAMFDAARNEP